MDIQQLFHFLVALLVVASLITSLVVVLRNRRSRRADARAGYAPGPAQHHPAQHHPAQHHPAQHHPAQHHPAQPPQQRVHPEQRGWYPPR